MALISEEEYEVKLAKIKAENASKERKRRLKKEQQKSKRKFNFTFKKPSTSKLLVWSVILLCLQIVLFSEWAMIKLQDASAMYALIGIPAAVVGVIVSYNSKSKAENTVGGIVYETAMKNTQTVNHTTIQNTTNQTINYTGELSDDSVEVDNDVTSTAKG